jgi:hypothetical protein
MSTPASTWRGTVPLPPPARFYVMTVGQAGGRGWLPARMVRIRPVLAFIAITRPMRRRLPTA